MCECVRLCASLCEAARPRRSPVSNDRTVSTSCRLSLLLLNRGQAQSVNGGREIRKSMPFVGDDGHELIAEGAVKAG